MSLIASGIALVGKGIGAAVGNKKGKDAADEQNLIEQQNYEMQYDNQQKQREFMQRENSQQMMQTFDPAGATQKYWKTGGMMAYPYQDQPRTSINPTLLYQKGGTGIDIRGYPERVYRSRKGSRPNKDGSQSTVLMSSSDNFAFPMLFQDKEGKWKEYDKKDWRKAMDHAKKTGELYEFNSNEEANSFAEGSWKGPGPQQPGSNPGDPYESTDEFPHGSNIKKKNEMKNGGKKLYYHGGMSDNMGMQAAHPFGAVGVPGYQNGGNLLQLVQAGNPNAYWPKTYATNANNPGNVGRHRNNMDMRYPGSSQNFQGGGIFDSVNMKNIRQLPEAFSNLIQDVPYLTDKYIMGNEDAVNPRDRQAPQVPSQQPAPVQKPIPQASPYDVQGYQHGGNLLQRVQAGNPNAYWMNNSPNNLNNPGNVMRHRDNMDLRYPGSSQNFSKPNAQQGATLPGTPIEGRPGFYNDQQGRTFDYYSKPPEQFNISGAPSAASQAIGDEINLRNPGQDLGTPGYYGPKHEQANRRYEGPEARRATPPASQGTPPPMGTIPQRQPDPVIPGGGGGNVGGGQGVRDQGGNERKFKRQQQKQRGKQGVPWTLASGQRGQNQWGGAGGRGSRARHQMGGNMYDELQDIGYDEYSAFQMGGGMPPQGMPADGGNLQPISDNSMVVQGNNPNEVDGVDVGNAMVDNGEMIKDLPQEQGQRVFSDTLKLPGSSKTIAEEAKKLEKQKDPDKPEQNARIEQKLDELFQMQQVMNGDSHGEGPEEAAAGGMDPVAAQNAGKPIAQGGALLPEDLNQDNPEIMQMQSDSKARELTGEEIARARMMTPFLQGSEGPFIDAPQGSMAHIRNTMSPGNFKADPTKQAAPVDGMLDNVDIIGVKGDGGTKAIGLKEGYKESDLAPPKGKIPKSSGTGTAVVVNDYDADWDYKMDGDKVYTKRKNSDKWRNVTNTSSGKAIYNDVFLGKQSMYGLEAKAQGLGYKSNMKEPELGTIPTPDPSKTGAIAENLPGDMTADEFYNLKPKVRREVARQSFGRRVGVGDIDRIATPGSVTLEDINNAGMTIDDYFNMKRKDRNAFEIAEFGRKLTNKDRKALSKDSKLVGEDMLSGAENEDFSIPSDNLVGYQQGGYTDMNQQAAMLTEVPYPGGRDKEPAFVPQKKHAQDGMFGNIGSFLGNEFAKPEGGGMSSGMGQVLDGAAQGVSGGMQTFGSTYMGAYGKGIDSPGMAAQGYMQTAGSLADTAMDPGIYQDFKTMNERSSSRDAMNMPTEGVGMEGYQQNQQAPPGVTGLPGLEMGGHAYGNGGYGDGFDYRNVGPPQMSFGLPMSMLAIARQFPTPGNADLDYLRRQAGGSWGEFSTENSSRRESEDMGRNKRDYNDETPNVNLRSRKGAKLAVPSKKKMREARGFTAKKKRYQAGGWLMPSISLNKKSLMLAIKTGV